MYGIASGRGAFAVKTSNDLQRLRVNVTCNVLEEGRGSPNKQRDANYMNENIDRVVMICPIERKLR